MKLLNISKDKKFLTMEDNTLSELSLTYFDNYKHLENLVLTFHKIRIINDNICSNNIESIYICSSTLITISELAFGNLKVLKYLHFEAPKCRNLPELRDNIKLETVKLYVTAVRQIPPLLFHEHWQLRHLELTTSVISLPDNLFGSSLQNLHILVIDYVPLRHFLCLSTLHFQYLTSLTILRLSNIEFSGQCEAPNETILKLLSRLRRLTLINCYIKYLKLSRYFTHLPRLNLARRILTQQDIVSNINHIFLYLFESTSQLRYLNMSHYILFNLRNYFFRNLRHLYSIHFTNCSLNTIEDYCFEPCAKWLHFLNLSCNNIQQLGSNIFYSCKNLVKLDLSFNRIRILSSNIFNELQLLKFLNLEHNHIDDFENDIFSKLVTLNHLNLNQNQITEFLNNQWFNYNTIYNLETLTIKSNTLRTLPEIDYLNFSTLKFLTFQSNIIRVISYLNFQNLLLLSELDLSYNSIEMLNQRTFDDLKNLRKLNFSQNCIKIIEKKVFKNLTHLKWLDLSYNQIEILDEELFRYNRFLTKICLESNSIKDFPQRFFYFNYYLEYLDISMNDIDNLDLNLFFINCCLKYVISGNPISNLISNPFYHP